MPTLEKGEYPVERYLHVQPIKKDCVTYMVAQVAEAAKAGDGFEDKIHFSFLHQTTTRFAFPLGDKEPREDAEYARRVTALTCRAVGALRLLADRRNYHNSHIAPLSGDVLTKKAVERAANIIVESTCKQAKVEEMVLLVGPELAETTKDFSVEQLVEDTPFVSSDFGAETPEFSYLGDKILYRQAVLLWLPKEEASVENRHQSKFHPLTACVYTDMQGEETSSGPSVIDDYLLAFTAPVSAFLFENIGIQGG